MNWDSFLDDLAGWLEGRNLLTPAAPWVVGVSGGPDSTLLLHALRELSERRALGWTLHAVHFHHGLRGDEADADARFVAGLAQQLGVTYHTEQAQAEGSWTEETARTQRYEFLERIALKTGSERVAVGHHADDNAETILHRICRGTGLRGLAGIPDVRPIQPHSRVRLIRPLLPHRRSTIEELCAARRFETRHDSSNASSEFTRNRIRSEVLPLLRETLNPNVAEALLRLAEQAGRVGEHLVEAAARTFNSLLIAQEPGLLVLSAPAVLGKDRAIQAEVVRRAIALLLDDEPDLGFAHVEAVLRLAQDPTSGKELHLPGPVVVGKRYDRLEFRPLVEAEPPPELATIPVVCPGQTPLAWLGADLVAEIGEIDTSKIAELRAQPKAGEEWLDYEQLRLPLFARGRREGDRFHPLGAPGPKSLADFLSDEKIEPAARARTGVLCDQDGPVWIIPLRIDERVKLSKTTRKALRLTLRPAGGS